MSTASQDAQRHLKELERAITRDDAGHETLEITYEIPPDLIYFKGHFPGDPLLPGVAQLNNIALAAIEEIWSDLGRLKGLRRLKFIRPLRPSARITLRLKRRGQGRVALSISQEEQLCTTANLTLATSARVDS